MSMIKRAQRRPSTWLILLVVASLSAGVVVLLSAAPAPITWTPAAVTATLPPGASTTRTVSFTSSQNFNNVTVRIVATLQPFVQVTPTSLSTITKGQSTTLTLTIAVPASALPGTVTGTLQLRTGGGTQGQDLAPPLQISITVLRQGNTPPVADAGPDQTVFVGQTVTLDGSKSSDADGDPLQYRWSLLVPTGSQATLADPTAVQPPFTVDVPGTYVAQLIVNDGVVDSAPDAVTITTQNARPVANAGPDQTVFVGDTVRLNGSKSSDVDGDRLTYAWSFVSRPDGSGATLSDPLSVIPTFVVDLPGTYVVQLIVDDGQLASDPDTVTISTANSKPVANAGPDQAVAVGATVHLDGRASSDADGDSLLYSWTLIARPTDSTATLTDSNTAQPSLVVDKPGTYVAQLIVDDGQLVSDPDTVMVVAIRVDTQPPDLRLDPPDGASLNMTMPGLTLTY